MSMLPTFSHTVVGLLITVAAIVMALSAIPLIMRKVPMNGLYGIRTRESCSSQHAWDAINIYGGKRLLFWMAMLAVAGLVVAIVPIRSDSAIVSVIVAPLITTLTAWIIDVHRFGKQYVHDHAGQRDPVVRKFV